MEATSGRTLKATPDAPGWKNHTKGSPCPGQQRRENLEGFAALDPFFRIIQERLAGLVDGEHFFDFLAEDVVVEYVVSVPGYPRRVQGRRAVADLYRGYGDATVLASADELAVHHDADKSVVVLEYAVHGLGSVSLVSVGSR
ncbi:hypothetical protein ACH4S9_32815 [Streptomyces sp. NPDC021225]|uniref:hypothetical protein n=1 Tax=Streptomyces sp. NPDC021225 TaxID=3365121 RepID=UPI003794EF57